MSWIFIADDGEQVHYDVPPKVVELEQRIAELETEVDKWKTNNNAAIGLLNKLGGRCQRKEAELAELREALDEAYAEIRKQYPVLRAIFNRAVWDKALQEQGE